MVRGERVKRVHDLRIRGVHVVVRDREVYILFVLALDAGAVFERLLHIFFLLVFEFDV